MTAICHVAVVIPARDECELVDECLRAVERARRCLADRLGDRVTCSVVLVADGCRDDTAALARTHAASVIEVPAVGVGAARALGAAIAIGATSVGAHRLWLANTDADSAVGREWLVDQVAAADAGADVVIGGVSPRLADLNANQRHGWHARRASARGRGHVHGSNLGIRASSYLAAGGFAPLPEHEDVELVARLRAIGAHVRIAERVDVVTSGRSVGRTPSGYAGFLRALPQPTSGVVGPG